MATTVLVASGNGVSVEPTGTELAQVDVAQFGVVRITVANWAFSPSSITVNVIHIMYPGTPAANAFDLVDTYLLGPGENVSKSYEVPGETIALYVTPTGQIAGCDATFTIYGRPD